MAMARKDEGESGMSGFGYYVFELMARRQMGKQSELAFRLRASEDGYDIKAPQNLSNWLRGTQPPLEFVKALVRVLELTPEEENTLYRKYVQESRRSA